jgi:hypothetical protein
MDTSSSESTSPGLEPAGVVEVVSVLVVAEVLGERFERAVTHAGSGQWI